MRIRVSSPFAAFSAISVSISGRSTPRPAPPSITNINKHPAMAPSPVTHRLRLSRLLSSSLEESCRNQLSRLYVKKTKLSTSLAQGSLSTKSANIFSCSSVGGNSYSSLLAEAFKLDRLQYSNKLLPSVMMGPSSENFVSFVILSNIIVSRKTG